MASHESAPAYKHLQVPYWVVTMASKFLPRLKDNEERRGTSDRACTFTVCGSPAAAEQSAANNGRCSRQTGSQ